MKQAAATVFVVDDEPPVRKALRCLLQTADFRVETFASAEEFLEAYDGERPGCLVLDVRMPGMDGLELQRRLAAERLSLPIIMLSAHADVPMAVAALQEGAVHFLEKPVDDEELLHRVRDALELDAQLRRHRAEYAEINARLATLTDREREVLELLVTGKSAKLIALVLGTSCHTVNHQRAAILKKMHAPTIAELVRQTLVARFGERRE
jgi:FixJ family two-component response regulator